MSFEFSSNLAERTIDSPKLVMVLKSWCKMLPIAAFLNEGLARPKEFIMLDFLLALVDIEGKLL